MVRALLFLLLDCDRQLGHLNVDVVAIFVDVDVGLVEDHFRSVLNDGFRLFPLRDFFLFPEVGPSCTGTRIPFIVGNPGRQALSEQHDTETFAINKADAYGRVTNDLTVGEYSVVVSSVPRRETLEDSQFEQAVALREMGVMIPDSVLIDSSRLNNKADVLKQMQGDQESPEAQAAAELQRRAQEDLDARRL